MQLFKIFFSMEKYEPKFKFKEADLFPLTELKNQYGELIHLDQTGADWIVLFFYPQDNTPTCTKEACNLRDHFDLLLKRNLKIFGISPDGEQSHIKFISKYKLPYDLLLDENHKLASKLGIWSKKKFMGRVYDGIHRTTIVLNSDLRIHRIIYPVVSADHANQILETIP